MSVKEAINKRYTTRRLDENKKVNDEDIQTIVEAGINAPNGFGLEPWKFFIVNGNKDKLQAAAHGQEHVKTASHVIVLASYKSSYIKSNPEVISERIKAMNLTEDREKYYKDAIFNKMDTDRYFSAQNHIAAGYMALQAADLNLGSVIAGGIDRLKVAESIGIDTNMFNVDLIVSIGYNLDKEARIRHHRSKEDLVEKINLI